MRINSESLVSNLVIEEVFWQIQRKRENGEQRFSKLYCSMARIFEYATIDEKKIGDAY